MLGIFELGKTILNKVVGDKDKRDEYTLKLLELQQQGEFKGEDLRYQAIVAEANSTDKWTSRARPTFLYVMYIIILSAIPLGIVHCFNPALATSFSDGFKEWLTAVPHILWESMTAGFLGYCGTRSMDKFTAAKYNK